MALSILVGGYAAHSTPGIVAAAILWGYAYGLISSLGPAAAAVGLNSVVAFVIADAFSGSSMSAVPLQALLVLAGGVEQTLLLVILWPTRRYSAERHALGEAYGTLARFAFDTSSADVAAPHPAAIASARQTLADPAPFARRGDIAVFQALLDEAERMRASLAALATDRYRYEHRNEKQRAALVRQTGNALAPLLETISTALHEARAPVATDAEWTKAELAANALDALPGAIGKHARAQAHALLGQARTVFRIASTPARVRASLHAARRRPLAPPIAQTWIALRASLGVDSPFGRHALRLAIALGSAMLLARLGPIHRGYWVPMTVALVLRPDFRTTFTRGFSRIVGTLLGAIVATAIVATLHPSVHLDAGLAVLFAALGYFVFGINYAAYSVTVTAYVVFLLALANSVPEHDAVLERSIATLTGAALAAIVYLAWPTWESGRARIALAEQLEAYRAYALAILATYVDAVLPNRKQLNALQSAAWQSRVKAEASVDAMIAEPGRTHRILPRVALGVLAAEQRIGVALLALNAHAESAAHVARPALQPFIEAVDVAWTRCIALLRERSAASTPPLRERYLSLEKSLGETDDQDAQVLLAETDLLVDGLNTVQELLAVPRSRT